MLGHAARSGRPAAATSLDYSPAVVSNGRSAFSPPTRLERLLYSPVYDNLHVNALHGQVTIVSPAGVRIGREPATGPLERRAPARDQVSQTADTDSSTPTL